MRKFLLVIVALLLIGTSVCAAPAKLSPLENGVSYEWEVTNSGLVLIKRVDGNDQTFEVAYSSRLVSCSTEEYGKYPYIVLRAQAGDKSGWCYQVSEEPVGYMVDGQLEPIIEKTWPLKQKGDVK